MPIRIPEVGELTVEELDEVAGGAADVNVYCPTSNKASCNSGCSAESAGAGTGEA